MYLDISLPNCVPKIRKLCEIERSIKGFKNEKLMGKRVKENPNKLKKSMENYDYIKWLLCLIIPVSENYNALYGKISVLSILFSAAMSKSGIADVTRAKRSVQKYTKIRVPCDEWFRKLFKEIVEYDVDRMFNRIVKQHLNALRRAGKLPKVVDIAIDMHCYQRYDKKQTKYTVKTMFKKSAKLCEEYMTAQIVNVGATSTVAKLQVKMGLETQILYVKSSKLATSSD